MLSMLCHWNSHADLLSSYAEISGDVRYGTMDQREAEQYRGQIVMNTEEEVSHT